MDIKEINNFIDEAANIGRDSSPEFPVQFRCLGIKCPPDIASHFISLGEALKGYVESDSVREQLRFDEIYYNPQRELTLDDN